jgi:chemotaxis family two-component system response regulator Rcp1
MMNDHRQLSIMILEDNRTDVSLLKLALDKADIHFTATVFEDGEKAFRYIDNEAGTEAEPIPDVAIMDLNVPMRDGSEVLAHIRENPRWQHTAVVILSSSPRAVMINKAAAADCYITKPSDLDEFLEIGREIRRCIERVRPRQSNDGSFVA